MAPMKRTRSLPSTYAGSKRSRKTPLRRTQSVQRFKVGGWRPTAAAAAPLKQAMQIVALDIKETKLFKTAWEAAGYSVSQVAGKAMAACGFATTSAQDPSGGTTLSYGATVIRDLHMARPFHNDNADDNLAQMALEGRRVIPTSAHNVITISRSGIHTSTVGRANSAAPLYVRCITVTPKGSAGTSLVTDPANDLFITAWGQETGVNKTGTSAMASQDFMDAVVNPNKYKVLRDEIKIAYQPVTDASTLVYGGNTESQLNTVSQNPTAVRFKIHHQIAAKKGGQVLFNNPNTAVNAEAGHRREYTLLHFWQPGQIDSTEFADVPSRLTVRCRPYSAFKDG